MSPLHPMLVPVPRAQGTALPITGMVRVESTLLAERRIVMVTNGGSSGTIYVELIGTAIPGEASRTVPLLATGATTGGATSMRAMKAGLTIENVTAALTRGGRVYVLNAQQRVALPAAPSSLTLVQLNTFADQLIAHPDCRGFSGQDFGTSRHFHCHVADHIEYENFNTNNGASSPDGIYAHAAVWPGSSVAERPMSCIFVVLEIPATAQDYTFTAHGSFYTRWPLDTVGGQVARDIPTASLSALDKLAKAGKAESEPLNAVP